MDGPQPEGSKTTIAMNIFDLVLLKVGFDELATRQNQSTLRDVQLFVCVFALAENPLPGVLETFGEREYC